MSGTSGDGVDASLIRSNGTNDYESIKDKYFEYNKEIYENALKMRNLDFNSKALMCEFKTSSVLSLKGLKNH